MARAGQGTVEFTLVTLIMLPIVLGGFEIGRGVWYYNQISNLSREGARWIIVTAADGGTDYSLTGNTPGTYTLSACGCGSDTAVGWIGQKNTGLRANLVTVTITRPTIGTYNWGAPATVAVQYPFQPLLATYLGIPNTITLRASTTMTMQ